MKLLLIGPDASVRRMLAFGLTSAGDESSSASSSRGLVRLGDLLEYNVAIIDWEMSDEPPAQFVSALRSAAPELPMIAIVGNSAALADAEQTGLDDVLMKPVNVDELRQRLQRFSRTAVKRDVSASCGEIRFVTQSTTMEQVL